MRPPTQAGFSLVELVVALAIGLLVVGAVLATYLSSSQGQRVQAAAAQMDEDAQMALRLLSSEVMQAGYSAPTGLQTTAASSSGEVGPSVRFMRAAVPHPLLECGSGPSATAGPCANQPSNQSGAVALVVSYEATRSNTLLSGNAPSDCLGSSVVPGTIVTNRYYLSSASGLISLQCLGSALVTSAPLVSNIEGLKFWYGQANVGDSDRQPVRHVPASALLGDAATAFERVVSVRICVLTRSADAVSGLDGQVLSGYLDCDLKPQTSTDRRLRRAYFTTVALRNQRPV
jgi:type IV pilus assembly protein PilW